jgi:hypothetical protein
VIGAFSAKIISSQLSEFAIDERKQTINRGMFAIG